MKNKELKQLFREYFTFNRTERQGFTVLGIMLVLVLVLNYFAGKVNFKKPSDFTEARRLIGELEISREAGQPPVGVSLFPFDPNTVPSGVLDSLDLPRQVKINLVRYREKGGSFKTAADFSRLYGMNDSIFARVEAYIRLPQVKKRDSSHPVQKEEKAPEHFSFDPNHATEEDLYKLGLNAYQRKNLLSFREKGGKFRTVEDVSKIYGIDSEMYERLKPWIDIALKEREEVKPSAISRVDINQSDSLEFMALPGIGEVFSGRIIRYRKLLGGYHSIEQLMEVYGMTEERFSSLQPYMYIDSVEVQQIRINFAGFNELRAHPYISPDQAKKILKLRSDNGPFRTFDVLLEEKIFEPAIFEKIRPYLTCL
jgi:DNA uptake protein ComE-like DNA-binding protein